MIVVAGTSSAEAGTTSDNPDTSSKTRMTLRNVGIVELAVENTPTHKSDQQSRQAEQKELDTSSLNRWPEAANVSVVMVIVMNSTGWKIGALRVFWSAAN